MRVNAAKGTLLATGGYAANPEMIRANLPLVPACCTAASYRRAATVTACGQDFGPVA